MAGVVGFVVCWYALILLTHWLVWRELEGRLVATDRTAAVVVGTGALCLLVPLVLIIGYVLQRGLRHLTPGFFTSTMELVDVANDPAEKGGAAHASIVGTLQQTAMAVLLAVPLGVLTAVFLTEVKGPLVRPVRIFVDAMSGVPSIVAGLFIYAVWIVQLGNRFSGFTASMALAVLMLPTITRTAEVVLRLVPAGLREASLALGASEFRTTWSVVLPTAQNGLVTAVVLGVARAIGETAPLLVTAGASTAMNANPVSGQQESLPRYVYDLVRAPVDAQVDRAWSGALVLVALVLLLFTLARLIGSGKLHLPRRKRRRTPTVERRADGPLALEETP